MTAPLPAAPGGILLLVDGHAMAYRAHYALMRQGLRAKDGTPTWAVYGFASILFSAISRIKPACVAVAFDLPEPTFRHEAFEAYKANRKPMPDDLVPQIDLMRELVGVLGIPLYDRHGYEADDVLGTIATRAAAEGWQVRILTGDRDTFQLVDERIHVVMPGKGVGDLDFFDAAGVEERMGLPPSRIVDYKGLAGDTSDNIPGVPGVGEKTAVELLRTFGSFEAIFAGLETVGKPKLRQNLAEHQELARISRQLATIDVHVPLDNLDWHRCRLEIPDLAPLTRLFERLDFKGLLRNLPRLLGDFLPGEAGLPAASAAGAITPAVSPVGQGALFAEAVPDAPQPIEVPLLPTPLMPVDRAGLLALREAIEAADGPLAFDTETDGLFPLRCKLVGLSLAWGQGAPDQCATAYVPVGHAEGPAAPLDLVREILGPLLASDRPKVAHNAKFDLHVLDRAGLAVAGPTEDSMLAAFMAEGGQGRVGLKELTRRVLGFAMTPIEDLIGTGRKQITMDRVPAERAAGYAAADAAATLALHHRYRERLAEAGQERLYRDLELPLLQVLARMERHGVRLDRARLAAISERLGERLVALEAEAHGLMGRPFNLASPRQLETILFDDLGLPAPRRTKTGRSTEAAVLEELQDAHPLVRLLLEHRQLSKLKGTYLDALPDYIHPETGCLHTSYNQHVAATGRLSSDNPNLQNIPVRGELGREIRSAFLPRDPGNVMVAADYSQIELRLLAHIARDEAFLEAFAMGQDIHTATASEIFGVPAEAVDADMRRRAKAVNFGVVYGQTAFGLARQLAIPQKEAKAFIDAYRARYPGIQRYMVETIARAHQNGWVETLMGRRRVLPGLRSGMRQERDLAERAAINAPIQGTAADLIKVAMLRVDAALAQEGLKARMVLQVHDELVLEVPPAEVPAVEALLVREMTGAMSLSVPLEVTIHAGPDWGSAK
ncbi:MAG: DNA polymerase I [Candidatus Sericytochromatia bacterium]|nr:DNA polymerase I [Candidatus Sericytochromatia bacterium]